MSDPHAKKTPGNKKPGETTKKPDIDLPANPRCGFVALIGAPNAGKSTLVNQLVGEKISIVTRKVQTTRARLRGVFVAGDAQIVLVDTPGIFKPKRRLDRAMVKTAWGEAKDADIVVLIIDAQKGIDSEVERILKGLGDLTAPVILALNKIDAILKEALLALAKNLTARHDFDEVMMLSALTGNGVDDLREILLKRVPNGPWLYPRNQMSDAPLRYMAAEITREKLYDRLHQELPYASTIETTGWKRVKKGALRIEQTIFVERESQKKIVLGKGGRAIKAISMAARPEIASMTDATVHLFLFVKVREKWGEDPERFAAMMLDFPK